jgi:hypothetical protein
MSRVVATAGCSRRAEQHMIGILAAKDCHEGADVIDDVSKWMSFDDTVAHVEATQKCYENLAIKLLQQAADSRKVRTRTVQCSSPWTVSGDIWSENKDRRDIEFWREDVLTLWPENQKDATRPPTPKSRSAIRNGILWAIDELWADGKITVKAKVRNMKIMELLRSHEIIGEHDDVTRTIQRVLKAEREAHK